MAPAMLEERGAPVRSWSFERHAKLHASPLPRRPGTCGRVLLAVLTALLFAGVGCGSEGSTDAGNRSDDRPTDPVIVDDDAQVGVASSTHEPDDDLDEARTPEDAESWMGVPWRASPSRYSETIEVWTRGQVDGDPACQTLLAKMVAVSEREVELHRSSCTVDAATVERLEFREDPDGVLYLARVQLVLRFRDSLPDTERRDPTSSCASAMDHFVPVDEEPRQSDRLGICSIRPDYRGTAHIIARVPEEAPKLDPDVNCLDIVAYYDGPPHSDTRDQSCVLSVPKDR